MNLNQVTIQSRDLGKSVPFYETLGLRLIVNSAPRYVRFECPDGNATFSIHHAEDRPEDSSIVVYFECQQLDEEYERLVSAGIIFDSEPVDQAWLWREAHLRDPDGNRIILFHAGSNRKYPPWRVADADSE